MPTKEQIEKIAQKVSDPFLEGMDPFAPLDTRGIPNFNVAGTEPSFLDENFAPLDTRGSGLANGLKKLISNPDEAALAEVAARTGDAEFLQKYREDREDQRQEQEATKFRQENPDTSNQ